MNQKCSSKVENRYPLKTKSLYRDMNMGREESDRQSMGIIMIKKKNANVTLATVTPAGERQPL